MCVLWASRKSRHNESKLANRNFQSRTAMGENDQQQKADINDPALPASDWNCKGASVNQSSQTVGFESHLGSAHQNCGFELRATLSPAHMKNQKKTFLQQETHVMSPNSADARQKLTKRHCSKHQAKIMTYAMWEIEPWQHLPIDPTQVFGSFCDLSYNWSHLFTPSVMVVRIFAL